MLLVSQFGTFVSFVLLGAAQSLPILFAARILDGITGGNIIVAQAYITDITPQEKRAQGLGIIFAGFGLGYIVGPAVGGLLAAVFDDRAPFFVGAVVSLMTVLLTYFALDESLPKAERLARAQQGQPRIRASDITGNTPLLLILIIAFFAQFSIAILQATIALYGEAVVFAGIGVGQFITQLVLLRPLIWRFGERRLVVAGAVLRGMGILSLAVFTSPWLIGSFSLVMIAAASGVMMPSLQALTTISVPEKFSGGVLGIYGSSVSLGIIVGTAFGGKLFSTSPTLPFVVAGLVLVATVLPALLLAQRTHDLKAVVSSV